MLEYRQTRAAIDAYQNGHDADVPTALFIALQRTRRQVLRTQAKTLDGARVQSEMLLCEMLGGATDDDLKLAAASIARVLAELEI